MFEFAHQLLEAFDDHQDQWHLPFPMGVFGTLRLKCSNNPLMGSLTGTEFIPSWRQSWNSIHYTSRHKAFLPHFCASGLGIFHDPYKAAVFEVFSYAGDEWERMIESVDRLEGFHTKDRSRRGYHRTLAWLGILPDDYQHELFESPWGKDPRVLPIAENEWDNYPKAPCWIYSSHRENERSMKSGLKNQPIIWFG